jgi:hypothetical protein
VAARVRSVTSVENANAETAVEATFARADLLVVIEVICERRESGIS